MLYAKNITIRISLGIKAKYQSMSFRYLIGVLIDNE